MGVIQPAERIIKSVIDQLGNRFAGHREAPAPFVNLKRAGANPLVCPFWRDSGSHFSKQLNMKKNKPKYLNYYYKWMRNRKMPTEGLCETFGSYLWPEELKLFPEMKLITPTEKNLDAIREREGHHAALYWGGDLNTDNYKFTPLRQNLVLLMAALNNEL